MEKISSHRVAVQDDNKNPLELLFLFDDTPIDGGSPDTEPVKPAHSEKLAFLTVNLPIIDRSFGAYIVVNVCGDRPQYLVFHYPRIEGDELLMMPLRCCNHFLPCGMIARRSFLSSHIAQ